MMTSTGRCGPIRIRYFLRIPNVGDRINPSIITKLTGADTQFVSRFDQPHVMAIGSILGGATPHSQVWGSGVMHPDLGLGAAEANNIHALRGALSHSALRRNGLTLKDIPLGDPGYLAPALMGIARADTPTRRVGIVRHYVDRFNPIFERMLMEEGVVDLNVHDAPEEFLRAMAECATVVSTSLHGLIFAEALGVPNIWVRAGNEIAGGDFKFQDWFTTTRHPQVCAHDLTAGDSAEGLARGARLHECEIDADALMAAFPRHHLETLSDPVNERLIPVAACRQRPTPVFLISFNRGAMLKQVMASIQDLSQPTDIIVQDNGSTDPETLQILDQLEADGTTVVRRQPINSADELNLTDDTVQAYFADWAEPASYVVSDCDVDLSVADPRALEVYELLLNRFRRVECVGPMLRIRDVPQAYSLYNRVMNRHIEQFWHKVPSIEKMPCGEVAVLEGTIDTTFALHRAGEPFRRLKAGLRVYEPFEALHLDWYMTDEDSVYAETSNAAISHWDNKAERDVHRGATLEYADYYAVRARQDGRLEIHKVVVSPSAVDPAAPGSAKPIAPFAAAPEEERVARIRQVEAMRAMRASDEARWSLPVHHNPDWAPRGVALAQLIKAGEAVFEFGAGRSGVAAALPLGCNYTPSDLAPLSAGMRRYDLNGSELEPIVGHQVALFSGVLEYVHDLRRLARFLASSFSTVICSYAALSDGSQDEIERRRYSGWFNDLKAEQFVVLFANAGFTLTHQSRWQAQNLFRFDRSC